MRVDAQMVHGVQTLQALEVDLVCMTKQGGGKEGVDADVGVDEQTGQ